MIGNPADEDDLQAEVAKLILQRDQLLAACKLGINALGMHGPCKNNSCRDCGVAWKQMRAAIASTEKE